MILVLVFNPICVRYIINVYVQLHSLGNYINLNVWFVLSAHFTYASSRYPGSSRLSALTKITGTNILGLVHVFIVLSECDSSK